MDDTGPQSLFVVVSYNGDSPRFFSSIIQLETKVNNLSSKGGRQVGSINYEYVAHFAHPQGYPRTIRWLFPRLTCSPKVLCLVPDWGSCYYQKRAPLLGCVFDFTTKEFKSIKPPGGSRLYKHVVDFGDDIYIMGANGRRKYESAHFFARYNRLKDSWEILKPFPYYDLHPQHEGSMGIIAATAVWNNTILLTMNGCGMWAYDVATNKWYPVVNLDHWCNKIVGKAVVLEDTIYAFIKLDKMYYETLASLSIRKEETKDGIVFICSLCSKISVPGLDDVEYDERSTWWRTRELVLMGKDDFCIVRSCFSREDIDYQPIQVTNLKRMGENSMIVTGIYVHKIKIVEKQKFEVRACFSLPEYMTTAFKEDKRLVFFFDPFPEDYAPKALLRYEAHPCLDAHFTSKPFQDNNNSSQKNITAEGHSIHVSNLPPEATLTQLQLEKRLSKFGPIIKDGVHFGKNEEGKPYAIVEFEIVASKERAVEASTITIVGWKAEISEESRTVC